MTDILALYSSTPQQGKSTVARVLQEHTGAPTLSFAHAPRNMLATLMRNFGHDNESVHFHLYGHGKNVPIEGIGRSYRHCMESLASGWGRGLLGEPDIWLRQVEHQLEKARKKNTSLVLIDDLRMPHEYDALMRQGAVLARVINPAADTTTANQVESNRGLDDMRMYPMHTRIVNDGSLSTLELKALSLLDSVALHSRDAPRQNNRSHNAAPG